jgi:hypothetical protein
MSLGQIKSALITQYMAIAGGVATAYPNMAFNAPGGLWAAIQNINVTDQVATLGDSGDDEVLGYFQIAVNDQLNVGDKNILDFLELMRVSFKMGSSYTYETQAVQIIKVHLSPVFANAPYATGVIQFYWRARIQRS